MGGVGSLGIVPGGGRGMPPIGIEYVLGTPSGQAILRPLRYPFYDTEKFENLQTAVRAFFTDPKKFEDGTAKTEADTNMTLGSQIGHPNLFDLIGFSGELEYGTSQADFNDFYTKCVLRWVFGQNTIFTKITVKKLPQGTGPVGFNAAGTIITNGFASGREFYNFTTPDRKARRIDSVEQFRGEIQPVRALALTSAGRKFTLYMLGILYSSI